MIYLNVFFNPPFIHSSLHQHTEEESVVKILLLFSSVEASRGLLPCVYYFCKKASVFVFVKVGQHNKYLILMHVGVVVCFLNSVIKRKLYSVVQLRTR